jgi:hypothetical protein
MTYLGFFGVQLSLGLTQSAVNPLSLLIGASPEQLPILNLAGPVTGLVIQPLIKAASDRTWSPRWGRRRPFITIGALLCSSLLSDCSDQVAGAKLAAVAPRPGTAPGDVHVAEHHGVGAISVLTA